MCWRQTKALLERHLRDEVSLAICQQLHPMIQNGPPAPARLLASFKMMDKSQAF